MPHFVQIAHWCRHASGTFFETPCSWPSVTRLKLLP